MAIIEKPAASPATITPESVVSVGGCVGQAESIRALLIEPDPDYRAALSAELSRRGFAIRGFDDGAALLSAPEAIGDADVIVASWGTPAMSGLELSIKLSLQGITAPLVLLAGRALQARECLAFDPGTGAFVAETRGVEALVGHLRAVTGALGNRRRP